MRKIPHAFQGCKLRRTQTLKYRLRTRKYTPCSLHPLCATVSEESGNSLFPGGGPAVAPPPTLSPGSHQRQWRKAFHTSLITRLEGSEGGGGRIREGRVGGESPHRARPQSRFPMPTSDHQSRHGAEYREIDLTSLGARHSQRGKERRKGEMSKTRSSLTTLTSPLCNPCTARAPHGVGYKKAEPEHHISISIFSSLLLSVSRLAHALTHVPVSTFRCC